MRKITILSIIFLFSCAAISYGGATGYWSDEDGNNYYGDPDTSSSSNDTYYDNTSYTNTGYTTYDNTYQQQVIQREEMKIENEKVRRQNIKDTMQQQQNEIERIKSEKLQKAREERARRQEVDERRKKEFKKGKKDLTGSLKDGRSGKLRLQEDYYKTLKTGDVPLRTNSGRSISKQELRQEKIGQTMKDMNKKRGSISEANSKFWAGVSEKKKNIVDWIKMRTFDETFNQIPIVSRVRSIQTKSQGWYKGIKELFLGVYEDGMGAFGRGARELGTDDPYYGISDYDHEETGNKARERAGEMVSSELEGKGTF